MKSGTILSALLCLLICSANAHEMTAQEKHAAEIISVLEMHEEGDQDAGYTSVVEIGEDITTLKNQLDQDQVTDDNQYASDKARIEAAIQVEENAIAEEKIQRQAIKDKLTALRKERALVEKIYNSDRLAYLNRIQQQATLVNTLDQLVSQTEEGLVNNPNVPEGDFDNTKTVLANLKQLGHGHTLEAFAQMQKLFTKADAKDLVERFANLEDAIKESQRIDQQKEDYNQELYGVLSRQLDDVLIPQAVNEIAEINASIKKHRKTIEDLTEELRILTNIYVYRKTERANAIGYSNEAFEDLQADLSELIKSEIVVRTK